MPWTSLFFFLWQRLSHLSLPQKYFQALLQHSCLLPLLWPKKMFSVWAEERTGGEGRRKEHLQKLLRASGKVILGRNIRKMRVFVFCSAGYWRSSATHIYFLLSPEVLRPLDSSSWEGRGKPIPCHPREGCNTMDGTQQAGGRPCILQPTQESRLWLWDLFKSPMETAGLSGYGLSIGRKWSSEAFGKNQVSFLKSGSKWKMRNILFKKQLKVGEESTWRSLKHLAI